MSLLVDTGVLYAHHDKDAKHHEAAKEAMTAALKGEYGQPYVTDYVYDETVTLTRRRMKYSRTRRQSATVYSGPCSCPWVLIGS
jgi:predicted nucleic acid-binding protein